MRRALLPWSAAAIAAAVLTTSCAGGGPHYDAAPAPAVDLAVTLPANLTIGVVRSSGAAPDLLGPASGARVAEYRLDGLHTEDEAVRLKVVNDNGTAQGAIDAIEELAKANVAGVVYASTGEYLDAAFQRADDLRLPLLAPFELDDALAQGRSSVWLTGPTAAAELQAITALNVSRNLDLLVVQASPSYMPDALISAFHDPIKVTGSAEAATLDKQLVAALDPTTPPGAILVWGTAADTANTVAAIQRFPYASLVPVYTSSDTTRPSFADQLANLQAHDSAVSDGPLLSVLTSTDLDKDADTRAFLSALRLAAADEGVRSLDGVGQLGIGAAEVDARAHDAVLLLANAARLAGSGKAAPVLKALKKLRADDVPGLVGPMPNFARSSTIPASALVIAQADPLGSDARTNLPGVKTAGPLPTGPRFGWLRVGSTKRS